MGLFSGLMDRGTGASLDVSTAVMIPVVAAMLADGQIDDDEVCQIRSLCVWSPIYARNTADRDTEIILKAIRLVEDSNAEAMCRKAAETLSPGLRETAFVFAVRMVFADGHVGRKEQQLIEAMTEWLGLSNERARMFIETVSVMQHDASV